MADGAGVRVVAAVSDLGELINAAADMLDALKAIKRFGELACVEVESGFPSRPSGKKPATKDVWQFPRHLLVEIDAAIANGESAL